MPGEMDSENYKVTRPNWESNQGAISLETSILTTSQHDIMKIKLNFFYWKIF